MLACTLATGLLFSGCSNSKESKNDVGTLIVKAPATGEASNLSERNSKERLI